MSTNKHHQTSLFYNLGSALFAFLLWGGWAYYINKNIISSLTQGTASFVITLFLVRAISTLYGSLSNKTDNTLLPIILPAVITVSFTTTFLYIAHIIAGTAHIIKTIAPALLVAFLFCLFTAYKIKTKAAT